MKFQVIWSLQEETAENSLIRNFSIVKFLNPECFVFSLHSYRINYYSLIILITGND